MTEPPVRNPSDERVEPDPEADAASIWSADGVRLRPVEAEDWPLFLAWNSDDEAARRLFHVPLPQPPDAVRRWTAEEAGRFPDDDRMRWIVEDGSGEAVGTINTHSCDRRNGVFGYGVHIDARHRRRGIATAALRVVLRFFFGELRYQKANVQVFAFNAESAALHERLGFRLEGRLRRSVYTGGAFHDVLLYGLTDDEFAALDGGSAGR